MRLTRRDIAVFVASFAVAAVVTFVVMQRLGI